MTIWTVSIAMLFFPKPSFMSGDEYTCPLSETSCFKETKTTDRNRSNNQMYCKFRNLDVTTPPTLFTAVQTSYP